MKAQFSKFGPKYDYRGAHVALEYRGRTLLGEIKETRRNEVTGCVVCKVQHFCGDFWPIEPGLSALEIIERTYKAA